ncbi:MAG: ABC transporter permease [Acidobacteriota bacterium]|nr:ABC transporter permease [Acidobacteriota bacterium]
MLQDLRYALRTFRKTPGFTAAAVLALALGVGANTAIFSVVHAVLLRPLPYRDPGRLVMVWEKNPAIGGFLAPRLPAALKNYHAWKQSRSFTDMGAMEQLGLNLTGIDKPEQLEAARATADLFSTLGIHPALGRAFLPGEGTPGRDRVAILSYKLFERRFGGDSHILGRAVTLNNASYVIIGVLPREFHLPAMWEGFSQNKPEIWLPLDENPAEDVLGNRINFVFARLAPGVTLTQARSEMDVLAKRLQREDPKLNSGFSINVFPLSLEDVGQDMSRTVLALQVAVGFVLLIACANVANLLLTKGAARAKEFAIRVALGAARWRLIRQMFVESLLLSGIGGAAGLLLAAGAMRLIALLAPEDSYHLQELSLNPLVLAFTGAVVVLSALIFGLAPSFHASDRNGAEALAQGGRAGSSGLSRRFRNILVVSEVTLAVILLAGAGLMIRSLASMLSINPGFRSDHILTLHVPLPDSKYEKTAQSRAFCNSLLDRVTRLPGVESAAIASGLPMLDTLSLSPFRIEGRRVPPSSERQMADQKTVSEDYFGVLRTPLLKGRSFTRQDAEREEAEVVVVNEAFIRHFLPDADPVGQVLIFGAADKPIRKQIVGVVAGTRQMGLDTDMRPEIFFPTRQVSRISLIMRTAGDPLRLASAVSEQVWSIDKDQPVADIMTMDKRMSESSAPRRFNMLLFAAFAALALLPAAVGMYGVLSYTVTLRTREMGLRMALGASPSQILKLIVGQGLAMTLIGIVIGTAAAFGLIELMRSLLFGISPNDPFTFIGVPLVLFAVALLASYLPTRRAARLDPMQSLRVE